MVGVDFRTSQLIPPFIIFSGGFCKTLMKKAQNLLNYHKTIVIFTKKMSDGRNYHDLVNIRAP